jgi:hypothetical protein
MRAFSRLVSLASTSLIVAVELGVYKIEIIRFEDLLNYIGRTSPSTAVITSAGF